MRINIQLDSEGITEKPKDKKFHEVRNRLFKKENHKEIQSPKELLEILDTSRSFIPCKLIGNSNSKQNFVKTNLIILDIDNNNEEEYLSIAEAEQIPIVKEQAIAIQKSISYSKDKEKYKIIFLLEEPICNHDEMIQIYESLFKEIPGCDIQVNQSNRLFFGGKGVVVINKDNRLFYERKRQNRDVNETIPQVAERPSYSLANTNDFFEAICSNDKEKIKEQFSPFLEKIDCTSSKTIHEDLLKIDLRHLLNVSDSIPCFFHDDHNPSASIFESDKGYSLYKCYANSCGFSGNLINIIKEVREKNMRYVECFNWLCKQLDLYTNEYQEVLSKKDSFFDTLDSKVDDEESKINSTISKKLEDMKFAYEILLGYVHFDSEGGIYCAMSGPLMTKLINPQNRSQYQVNKWNKLLSFMCFLGILEKVDDNEAPEAIVNYLNKLQEEKQQAKRTSLYKLFSLDGEVIKKVIEQISPDMNKFRFTFGDFSYALVKACYDKETADAIFPQVLRKEYNQKEQQMLDCALNQLEEQITGTKEYYGEQNLIENVSLNLNFKKKEVKQFLKANRGFFYNYDYYLETMTKDTMDALNIKKGNRRLAYIKMHSMWPFRKKGVVSPVSHTDHCEKRVFFRYVPGYGEEEICNYIPIKKEPSIYE